METAVTHPTGRGMPLLWRMYMSLEVCIFLFGQILLSRHSCGARQGNGLLSAVGTYFFVMNLFVLWWILLNGIMSTSY